MRQRVQETIDRLRLDGLECRDARAEYYDAWLREELDGEPLPAGAFSLGEADLTIGSPPVREFVLESRVRIQPHTNTARFMTLSLAFAASCGGMGSLVGGGRCMVAAAFLMEFTGIEINFLEWMVFAMPLAVVTVPARAVQASLPM